MNRDSEFNPIAQQFQVIPYNNLVYLIRVGLQRHSAGTWSANTGVNIRPADRHLRSLDQRQPHARAGRPLQAQRHAVLRRHYTPTTMVDSLDNLDFTSITGETFYAPTIFIPIPEIDSTQDFVADLSNFLGQQFWTFIYSEVVAQPGADGERRPLSRPATTSTSRASRSSACKSCTSSTTRWPCCSRRTI